MRNNTILNWQRTFLYDTEIMPKSGIDKLDFFIYPPGTIGHSEKTIIETNMERPGQLREGCQFIFDGIAISFTDKIDDTDLKEIKLKGLCQLYQGCNEKIVEPIPLTRIPFLFFDTKYTINTLGDNCLCDVRYGGKPLLIRSENTFKLQLLFPRGLGPLSRDIPIIMLLGGSWGTPLNFNG